MGRTYRVPRLAGYYVAVFSLVWSGGVLASTTAAPSPHSRLELALLLGWILAAFLPLFYLFVVYEVTVTEDGTCEFRSVLRRRRVRAQQIISISTDEEAIYIRYPGGKVHMWETRDFDDLLRRLVELNPAIELRGWVGERVRDVSEARRASL
jgi:hypothetical protein